MLRHNKLKLNKGNAPNRYSLSYKRRNGGSIHYDILLALAGSNDVIIELNTDLFIDGKGGPHDVIEKFLHHISSYGLVCRQRMIPSMKNMSILGFHVETKKKEAREVTVYVPNAIWKKKSFQDVLPQYGVRYCVTKEPMDAGSMIDHIGSTQENEKEDTFRMILFDISLYGQMGIVSKLGEEEIKKLLSSSAH